MEVVKGQMQTLSESLLESELQNSLERSSPLQDTGERKGNNVTDPETTGNIVADSAESEVLVDSLEACSLDFQNSFINLCKNDLSNNHHHANYPDLSESLQNLSLTDKVNPDREDLEKVEYPIEFGAPLCTSTPKKSKNLQSTTGNNQSASHPNWEGILSESVSLCESLSESLQEHESVSNPPSPKPESEFESEQKPVSTNSLQDTMRDPYSFHEESGNLTRNESKLSLYTSVSSCDDTCDMEFSELSESSHDIQSAIHPVDHVGVVTSGRVKSKVKSSPHKSRKYKFKIRKQQLKSVFRGKCCAKKCTQKATRRFVKDCRRMYWRRSLAGRKQWLLDKINESHRVGRVTTFAISQELLVCRVAFQKIHGISKSTFFRCQRDAINGVKISTTGLKIRMPGSHALVASVWIEKHVNEYGDRMPNREEIQLPVGTTRKGVYTKYKEECLSRDEQYISESHFMKIWREQYPTVKIKKQYDNFSKCNKCALFQRALGRTQNVDKRRVIRLKRDIHINRQMTERKDYYRKRDLARQYPDKYLSLIIDGMDQSKTFIPHFIGRKAKAIKTSDLLKTHITTVLNHGERQQLSFLDKGEYPHDSNMTAAILLEALWIISKKGKALPPILFLQADNCWRENKNRYILGLCEMMVSLEIFHEIQLSFLFVGHTHEDIDQYFSQLARHLRSNEAETLPDLIRLLPNVMELKSIPDVKSWITPRLKPVKGHTAPLQFKFTGNSKRKGLCQVDVQYRGSCTQDWKHMPNLLVQIPTKKSIQAKPKNVLPDFDPLVPGSLDARICKWSPLFDPSDSSSFDWWKCFAAELKNHNSSERKRRLYASRGEKWLLPKFSKCNKHLLNTPDFEANDLLGSHLVDMLTEESQDPEVTVGQKKRQRTN